MERMKAGPAMGGSVVRWWQNQLYNITLYLTLCLLCSINSGVAKSGKFEGEGKSDVVGERCAEGLFECGEEMAPQQWCISKAWVCDGERDCPDGKDEEQDCPPLSCPTGKFQCLDQHLCITMGWMCDGEPDCIDGSDEAEEECPVTLHNCPPNKYLCDGTRHCLNYEQLCDGQIDCPDGSDEGSHCRLNRCADHNCSSPYCHETLSGALCACGPGATYNITTRTCQADVCDFSVSAVSGLLQQYRFQISDCKATGQTPLNRNPLSLNCEYLDECLHDGFCDQLCTNHALNHSYTCSCVPGYKLVNSSRCLALNDPVDKNTIIILSTSSSIELISIENDRSQSQDPVSFIRPKYSITGSVQRNTTSLITVFDYNFNNESFCFLSTIDAYGPMSLICAKVNDPNKHRWTYDLMFPLSTSIRGMAFDWFSLNWYFADDRLERIFVCNPNNSICVTILSSNLKSPNSIAIDPAKGLIFFTTLGVAPCIERSDLMGRDRRPLGHSKQIVRPQALSLDLVNEYIYWLDTHLDSIERSNYDGTDRKLIFRKQSVVSGLFGLSLHDSMLYALSPGVNESMTLQLHLFSTVRYSISDTVPLNLNSSTPSGIKIVHRQRQPIHNLGTNPCIAMICNHICVAVTDPIDSGKKSAKCLCMAGYKLRQGSPNQCILALEPTFLLYSNAKLGEIKGISLNQSLAAISPEDVSYEVMRPITDVDRPVAIDYDRKNQYIYYSDAARGRIGRRKIDVSTVPHMLSSSMNEDIIVTGIHTCEGIAIDWLGDNLYWTDERMQTISVARLANTTIRRTLVETNLSHPRAIVLYPGQGYMFWTDWVQRPSPIKAKIERANMDGTDRRVWVNANIQWPNSLSIDYTSQRLYWCDAYMDSIESIDINEPTFRLPIADYRKGVQHPYGLVQFEGVFFWTEFMDGFIKRISAMATETRNQSVVIRQESAPLFDLKLFNNQSQPGQNDCFFNNGNCSHLCLATSSTLQTSRVVCQCNDSWVLNVTDNKTCIATGVERLIGPTCPPTSFRCANGQCINQRWLCDGDNDCEDFSDENITDVCHNASCVGADMYRCRNNRCIYQRWFCDGEDDCKTGEDESPERCNSTCMENMTQCPNSYRCIPHTWLCDHDSDCEDGFDEQNCSYEQCRQDQFMCRDQHCISYEYVCDGDSDCDGSDEENCDSSSLTCNERTHFLCNETQLCIPLHHVCDGQYNCGANDTSDEKSCAALFLCDPDRQFQCRNRICIPKLLFCDGDDDCGDNSDEICNKTSFACPSTEYLCPGENKCLPDRWKCDGDKDCLDNSDEKNCSSKIKCERPDWSCTNDNSVCVPASQLCDGKNNCKDGSDEGSLCGTNILQSQMSPAPDGFYCSCPPNKKLAPDQLRCIDPYSCDAWGVCSQRCTEAKDGVKCWCYDGYILEPDNFTCRPNDTVRSYIIFSRRNEIRRLDTTAQTYVSLVSGLHNTIALDFYYNHTAAALTSSEGGLRSGEGGDGSLVFWTDVVDDKIYKGTMISNSLTNIEAVISEGLATAEGLAIDWVTRHLYWVESNLDQIEASDFDGRNRLTVILGSMESPRAIVVDPSVGMLFWTDWDPMFPRIERCSMSGEGRKTIFNVSSIPGSGWPNGISVDYDQLRLYWIDARSDSIHTITYEGGDLREVLRGHEYLSHPFAISVFGNFMYWSDWRTNTLVRANKWNGSNIQVVEQTITQPFDLHIFHPKKQKICMLRSHSILEALKVVNFADPCTPSPCGKDAVCLLSFNMTTMCRCPHGTSLNTKTNNSCQPIDKLLLFTTLHQIHGLHMFAPHLNAMSTMTIPKIYSPVAIDFDSLTQRIYWTDDSVNSGQLGIHSNHLNGSNHEHIESNTYNPYGFGIDYLAGNMFLSSYTPGRPGYIYVSRLDGAYRTRLVLQPPLKQPYSLALHPSNGLLFWSDSELQTISASYMDGGNSWLVYSRQRNATLSTSDKTANSSFVTSYNNTAINATEPTYLISSLAVDYFDGKLWWIEQNGNKSQILYCPLTYINVNYSFSSSFSPSSAPLCQPITFVINSSPSIVLSELITSLAVDNERLYFAYGADESVLCSVKKDGSSLEIWRNKTKHKITAIRIYDTSRSKLQSGCSINNGGCSQLCISRTRNSRVCICATGFRLVNKTQCIGVSTFLMYSNGSSINGLSLNETNTDDGSTDDGLSSQVLAPIYKIENAITIDFSANSLLPSIGDWIYWVDNQARQINRIQRDLTQRQTVISTGLMGSEGLAVDWMAGNLYWTDQGHDVIEVSRLDGSHRYVLIHNDLDIPKGIVLHPRLGLMYWAECGLKPSINSARMDGTGRGTLVNSSIRAPYGLAIDFETDSLYWCDQRLRTISLIDLNHTGGVGSVIVSNVIDCRGIAVSGQYLYWIDLASEQGSILRANKRNGSSQTIIRRRLGRTVRDIKIFNTTRPSSGVNVCVVNNGGCTELCLFNGTHGNCFCAHGRKVNETQCEGWESFLAFSKVTGIETVHMMSTIVKKDSDDEGEMVINPNAPRPPIESSVHMHNVIGLAADYKQNRYFFSDIHRGDIQSVTFGGTNFRVIVANVGSAEGLAYDEFFHEVYWTSYTNSSISRISVSDQRSSREREKVVQLGHDDHPRAIVLDTCESKMYWTNWNDHQASIMSSFLSGWDVKKIVTTDIKTPNGLTIDHSAKKLYWSDAQLDKIERCNFDGTSRKVIVAGYPQHVFGLTVHGDYLYWTDWLLRAVLRANKYSGGDIMYLKQHIARQPMGIVTISSDADNCLKSACAFNNGGCDSTSFCVPDEYGTPFCTCPSPSLIIATNNKSCIPMATSSGCDVNREHMCADGRCIPIEKTCNGQTDCCPMQITTDGLRNCTDKSDELSMLCKTRICPIGYFHCNNGRCIRQSLHCDFNGTDDCGDNSDEMSCVKSSACQANEFPCRPNSPDDKILCIVSSFRCDGDKDCPDASDEIGCPRPNCTYNTGPGFSGESGMQDTLKYINCNHTTACILPEWICDGNDDCWDNSDEQNCTVVTSRSPCPVGWRACTTAGTGCVSSSWWCDGDYDCPDQSDERDCNLSCERNEWKCDGNKCIPDAWRCDNRPDCWDKSDEINCSSTACRSDQFACTSSKNCISKFQVCDGEKDCIKGEDEHPNAGCDPVPCDLSEFQCYNWQCIFKSFHCDGDQDCDDGSDEPPWCAATSRCDNQTQFTCTHSRQCIPLDKKCNGKLDCWDQSDESNTTCNGRDTLACGGNLDKYKCSNGKCVDINLFCNGKLNGTCGDNSYQDDLQRWQCGVNECIERPAVCSHICEDRPIGYRCKCKHGYQLAKDNRTCIDINECDHPICSHYCLNTNGSYHCYCAANYTLMADKHNCKANSSIVPVLIISNRYYLRNMSLTGATLHLIADNLLNAVALDFDSVDNMIYWSDVIGTGSNISRMNADGTNRQSYLVPRPFRPDHDQVLHSSTLRNPDGIAVDWLGRNLYWCDKTTDTIEVSQLDGRYRRVLVRSGLQEPRSLSVHPLRGLLFYTDWGEDAHIGRLGMDGSLRTQILNKDFLGWPNALTIDYITDLIYWADAKLDYIALADLNGTNMRYLLREHLPHIFSLTVFENHIYWTDWEFKSVERAHKITGGDRTNLTQTIHRPMAIQVFHPLRQPMSLKKNQVNPCASGGGCNEGMLCLIKPGGLSRVCSCPEKHYQSHDKRTCISNCTSSEYSCTSTFKCIPYWWRCDNQDDCGDASDEPASCPNYFCRQPGMFQCKNASSSVDCIPPAQICDGVTQCVDSSDELRCDIHTCLESQFKCHRPPKCIPGLQRCNGNKDCEDSSDEKNCPLNSCARNQFQCNNKRCIPYVWRCDGDDDCGDRSDEPADCTNSTCPSNYIRCATSGRCILSAWKCDGEFDCGEGDLTDEPPDCKNVTCDETYFKCNNSRCIPGRWRCDYDDDCRDGSDEVNCATTLRNCSESEFRCTNGRCISKSQVCDGYKQCEDGLDESSCSRPACSSTSEFQCSRSAFCLPKSWRCDHAIDCSDSSDELNCTNTNITCSAYESSCRNGVCIPAAWFCDGVADCVDKSDEEPSMCRLHSCDPGYFRCSNNRCIPTDMRCDGKDHCGDSSDERNCPVKLCGSNEFECIESQTCIAQSQVCDAILDCPDGIDESLCGDLSKNCSTNDNCQEPYICKRVPIFQLLDIQKLLTESRRYPWLRPGIRRGICACPDGFQPQIGTGQCEAICDVFARCSQRCHRGVCKCGENFHSVRQPGSSYSTCIAKGYRPYILFASEAEVYSVIPDQPFSVSRRYPFDNKVDVKNPTLKFSSMDFVVNNNDTVFVLMGSEIGGVYTCTLPLKVTSSSVQSKEDEDSENDKMALSRGRRDATNGLQRVNLSGVKRLGDLAVDWIMQRLYWTDMETGRIGVSNLDGTQQRTVIKNNLRQPFAIKFDPESMRIYWTSLGSSARIESSNLDGSDRKIIVQTRIVWPTDLAIDYMARRLYWVDMKRKTVETTRMDGTDRRVIWAFYPFEQTIAEHGSEDAVDGADVPHKLDVFEDNLYVLMRKPAVIYSLHKYGTDENNGPLGQGEERPDTDQSEDVLKLVMFPQAVMSRAPITDLLLVQQFKQSHTITDDRTIACLRAGLCGASAMCINLPLPYNYTCVCGDQEMYDPIARVCRTTSSKTSCEPGFCLHGETCALTEHGVPKCKCDARYFGERCETDRCYGLCNTSHTEMCQVNNYTEAACQCVSEYEGPRCDHNKCDNYCHNGATCIYDKHGNSPQCSCTNEYKGLQCETKRDSPCDGIECWNNGLCAAVGSSTTSMSLDYYCRCPNGFAGQLCETCNKSCTAAGICRDVNISCSVCLHSCTGPELDSCQQQQCSKTESHCAFVTTFGTQLTPQCICPPGYQEFNRCTHKSTQMVMDSDCLVCVDSCHGFCANAGVCSYSTISQQPHCSCVGVYTGSQCMEACDMCDVEGTARCITSFSADGSSKECICKEHYTGNTCSRRQCKNEKICLYEGQCIHNSQSQVDECECRLGYTGDLCETRVGCAAIHCQHGAVCQQLTDTYMCECLHGFYGELCEKKMPAECMNSCFNSGDCTDCVQNGTSFVCINCRCQRGYTGPWCDLLSTEQPFSENSSVAVIVPIVLIILMFLLIAVLIVVKKHRCRPSQFGHVRMTEGDDECNIEISNPIYLKNDDDDDVDNLEDEEFALDPHKPTNFSNPLYDDGCSSSGLLPCESAEKKLLLNGKPST